jgi:cytoskeletal protein CcmA (bactofilin family)
VTARSQRPQPDALEVIVGPRATFAGSMRSETSIRIDGMVEGGLIETPANVVLTETARVTCEIVARVVSIRGQFHGALHADRVELLAGSRVSGVLSVNSFYMDDGVQMQAEVNLRGAPPTLMVRPEPPALPEPARLLEPRPVDERFRLETRDGETLPALDPLNPPPRSQG